MILKLQLLIARVFVWAAMGALTGLVLVLLYSVAQANIPYKTVEVTVERPRPKLPDLLANVPSKYGIDPLLAMAVAVQESGKIPRMDASRFEISQVGISKKILQTDNEDQIRQGATSHCAMQVMGYNAYRFGLTWADLYDPINCVEVSMAILKDCLDSEKVGSESARIFGGLRCYNAGPGYRKRGDSGKNYANEVIWRYLDLVLRNRGERVQALSSLHKRGPKGEILMQEASNQNKGQEQG